MMRLLNIHGGHIINHHIHILPELCELYMYHANFLGPMVVTSDREVANVFQGLFSSSGLVLADDDDDVVVSCLIMKLRASVRV